MEKLNLAEILRDCPRFTEFWSPIYGKVQFDSITPTHVSFFTPIGVYLIPQDGYFDSAVPDAEIIIYPSKENRDWSTFKVQKPKFDINSLQPFDKVLVRDGMDDDWQADLFSHREDNYKSIHVPNVEKRFFCIGSHWGQCIPYNDDTKHLIGTTNKAPDFYVTWDKE